MNPADLLRAPRRIDVLVIDDRAIALKDPDLRFCRDALAQHARLFRLWHKFRGVQIDRGQPSR